jgi:putative esterase
VVWSNIAVKRILLPLVRAFALSLALAASAALATRAQTAGSLRFVISFPAARSAQPLDGRVLLFISDNGKTEPKSQSDQYRANSTPPIFGVDVDAMAPGQGVVIDERVAGWPARSLKDIPAGDYYVQALLNRYETFRRADGHTVKMPMDQGEGQHWDIKPGNFYSRPVKMRVDPAGGGEIKISLDQEIPPIAPNVDTAQVKYIRVQNERLTKFWGRPMHLGAIVTLPAGWDTHPGARYPLVIHHGHFPKDAASDTWRETPPDATAGDPTREVQEAAYQFYKDWNGPGFPRMIHVLVQHPTPYFDDSYAVNSANNGPYGDAITLDLIPYLEKQFRGIGQGWARALVGGSTGGWEALGVQVMYPDGYNGAWALCPDPIDFRSYRSVNIYDERNAYYYLEDNPWKRTPKPGYRDYRGHLYSTFEDRNLVELVLGTHGRSAGQQDAWASVFGPVGDDGYYKPLYDKVSGAIDPVVATYWRDHYDLRYIMERDWTKLGPKLRGKIHLTSGTMDNGYLNNAVYQTEEFFRKTTNPPADAEIVYGERREHCFTGDTEHPNAVGTRTLHQRYMPAMAKWMIKTAPAGADTKSWVY